jgi:multisubunit Na+/H+ antiporter MnhE subunit
MRSSVSVPAICLTMIIAAFVWALLSSSLAVVYAAVGCMTGACIGLCIVLSHRTPRR